MPKLTRLGRWLVILTIEPASGDDDCLSGYSLTSLLENPDEADDADDDDDDDGLALIDINPKLFFIVCVFVAAAADDEKLEFGDS